MATGKHVAEMSLEEANDVRTAIVERIDKVRADMRRSQQNSPNSIGMHQSFQSEVDRLVSALHAY